MTKRDETGIEVRQFTKRMTKIGMRNSGQRITQLLYCEETMIALYIKDLHEERLWHVKGCLEDNNKLIRNL